MVENTIRRRRRFETVILPDPLASGCARTNTQPVTSKRRKPAPPDAFETVRKVGLRLPGVEAVDRYDGTPVLKIGGTFLAGLASHRSAEPGTLVVRCSLDERGWLIDDAPETYYLTDYYRKYPLVLVRLCRIDRDALHDLLAVSRRLALEKAKPHRRTDRSRAGVTDFDRM